MHDMEEKFQDQEFIEYIVRNIVNHPNDVKTERIIDERGVLITLHINQEDMGYVIGREGQTARSLRTLLKIVGAKSNSRVNLKIHEPEGSQRPPRREAVASTSSAPRPAASRHSEPIDTSAIDLQI
jgi:hypothetical protein